MTELLSEIVAEIAAEGPISVARYMALALGHPRHGYYRKRQPFGQEGDFVTAPEISQMFGELIGLWAGDGWMRMGEPKPFDLIELGPGRGTLMSDALRALRVLPACRAALTPRLVETSEMLREAQRSTLGEDAREATWHARLDEIPERTAVIIANEFFDALPIRQYVRGGAGWHERLIGVDEAGRLSFGLAPHAEPALTFPAPEGAILEICPQGFALMQEIVRRVTTHGGVALLIDYGHAQAGFGDTLQAVSRHAFADPLSEPGDADLTAHVDFAALATAAHQAGAVVHGPVTQGAFLRMLGIEGRAARLKAANPGQADTIEAALQRLTGDGERKMGTLFKVMAISHAALPELAGLGGLARE